MARPRGLRRRRSFAALLTILILPGWTSPAHAQVESQRELLREFPDDPYVPPVPAGKAPSQVPTQRWARGTFTSVQVNVNGVGNNILGDAANEPSIAVDPNDPSRMAIGWRQFDNRASNFRQAGWAFSQDGGATWTFPGVIEPGIFRSDPVLDFDADGNFYYYSLKGTFECHLFKSTDGGATWDGGTFGFGGDKQWMTIDRTSGPGRGHLYAQWNRSFTCCGGDFTWSTDGGASFETPFDLPGSPFWGTLSVGPDGELYIVGNGFIVLKSTNAQNAAVTPTFPLLSFVDLGGVLGFGTGPNPGGLLGQAWIATDHSTGPTRGNVYVLASVNPAGPDPLDVMFSRSTDGGVTFSPAVRVNDDPAGTLAWQWFGTMSVAPNGRIDVVFNDTRNTGATNLSELFYTGSYDAGVTWTPNVPVSPVFNSHIGWPNQNKIGDYYDMVSDLAGVHVAYSATFNGEQDVYYLRIMADCNQNGFPDDEDLATGRSDDCNSNELPDECDIAEGRSADCSDNGVPDECEPDSDGDGLVDDCDNCPLAFNSEQTDGDLDGVGDACDPCPADFLDDRDGDGVCDSDEACPDDPRKLDPGQCGCGVSDDDTDGDGVSDCNDLCRGVDDALFGPECEGAIPAASTWGLVALALGLLITAKLSFGRRDPSLRSG